jgi:two-component system, sensor histidine kinase PdtaS
MAPKPCRFRRKLNAAMRIAEVSREAAQISRAFPMPETDTPSAAARRPWRISTQTVVIGQVALLLIVITVLSGVSVWREYDAAIARAEIQAGNAAQTASEHVRWLYEASTQALRRVDDLLRDYPDTFEAGGVGNLSEAVAALPRDTSLTVYNAQGHSILSTDPDRAQRSIAEREDFQVHQSGHEWHISAMFEDRATNRPVFTISRRVELRGVFAGAAVVVVPVELLARFWATLNLGSVSVASLVRSDGQLVARFPVPAAPVDLSGSTLFQHLPDSASGTFYAVSPIDGNYRMTGYYHVPNLPLIAVTGISMQAALDRLWWRLIGLALLGLPLILALIMVSAWIVVLLRRDEHTRWELSQALRQNEMLLREVHHRVKNNLQIVASLIRLQPGPPEAKTEMARRIAAMSAVHEQLYLSDQIGRIDVGEYLRKLVDSLAESYGGKATIDYDLDEIGAEIELALPLGLVVSEITSNAFKHAFPDGRPASLTVELKRQADDQARLRISDNGVGFDPEQHDGGLGLRLLQAFSQQLNATYSFHIEQGTTLELTFPLVRPTESAAKEMAAAA